MLQTIINYKWYTWSFAQLAEKYIPLDPQPHRHSMLVPTVCAPRVTRCSLGKYWSRDWFRGNFSLTQGLWNQQAANPGVHMLSMTHSGVRQRNLMMHAQCPLPVYYSQLIGSFPWCCTTQILLLQSCMYYMLTHLFSGYLCCLTQILVLTLVMLSLLFVLGTIS